MASYVDLSLMNAAKPVFSLFQLPGGAKTVLRCSVFRDDCYQIGVKVLQPKSQEVSIRKFSLSFSNDTAVEVEVAIGVKKVRLLVNLQEVAKGWGLAENVVKEHCDEGFFETLPLKSPYAVARTVSEPPTAQATPSSELSVTSVGSDASDAPPSLDDHKMNSGVVPQSILDRFPFPQLRMYLTNHTTNPAERISFEKVLHVEWRKIVRLIKDQQAKWIKLCEETGVGSLVIRDNTIPFDLEFFYDDFTTWIHLECADHSLALNTETGVLFRRQKIEKEKLAVHRQIQKLAKRCPHIQPHKVTLSQDGCVLVPFLSYSFEEALKMELVTPKMRHQVVAGWLEGLDILHAAEIAHWNMGPESLLLYVDPKTEQLVPVVGGFSAVYLVVQPPEQHAVTATFQKYMPPECRINDAFQQFVQVPRNPLAVDIYQMGSHLRGMFADLFEDADQIPTSSTITFRQVPRSFHILFWIDQMMSKNPGISRPEVRNVLHAWNKMPRD